MIARLKGLFSKWHCAECNSIMSRRDVKYQEEFCGHYTSYWFRCLCCGSTKDIKPINERIEQIIIQTTNKNKSKDID